MKKYLILTVVSLILVIVWGGQVFAQNSEVGPKPSLIALTPGQYVNGWPAFTVSYPKEWVEQPLRPGTGMVFFVAAPKTSPPVPSFVVYVFLNPLPIDNWSKIVVPSLKAMGRDIKIVYDKPSQLKDGAPAQEAEIEWVRNEGVKLNMLVLTTSKDNIWIMITFQSDKGKIGEDLKNYAYSLTFQQGREEPVKVPPDVREFLDKFCSDIVSHDVEKIMTNYSDQYLLFGMKKASVENFFRNNPGSPTQRGVKSYEATVTIFEAQGDKAYVDGFFTSKTSDDAKVVKASMFNGWIIKENGQWKWYGNQK